MQRMEAEQKAAEKLSAEERQAAMQKLTDDFEATIGGIVKRRWSGISQSAFRSKARKASSSTLAAR